MQILSNLLADGGLESVLSLEKLSIVGVLMGVFYLILTKRLVPGAWYEEMRAENRQLRKELEIERSLKRDGYAAGASLLQQMDAYEESAAVGSDTQPPDVGR